MGLDLVQPTGCDICAISTWTPPSLPRLRHLFPQARHIPLREP